MEESRVVLVVLELLAVGAVSSAYGDSHFSTNASDWGYDEDNGPNTWPESYPGCAGRLQSPIALNNTCAVKTTSPAIVFRNYHVVPGNITVTNTGHTVTMRGNFSLSDCNNTPQIKLGKDSFIFESIHFHWGSSDHLGSEHTLEEERYPLEMNVVHMRYCRNERRRRRKKRGPIDQRSDMAILVVFFEFTDESSENAGISKLVRTLKHIRRAHTESCLHNMPLTMLVPQFRRDYFVYSGSVTTPPCSECVTYVVSTESAGITHSQVAEFRKLHNDDGNLLVDNFRPIQPSYGRTIRFVH